MRVAVIGSGLGGLLAAALLRGRGVEVVRFDKAASPGGRARSATLGGVSVNLGPRALYRGGPLARALRSLGVRPAGFSPPTRGALAVVDVDGDHALRPLPATVADLVGSDLLRASDKRAFALAFARLAVGAFDVDDGEPLGAWLARHVDAGPARDLLAMLTRVATYAGDPAQDARLALAQTRRALTRGVLYVDGGWRSLVDPLAALAGPARAQQVRSLGDVDADAVVVALPLDDARALVPALPAGTPVTASCLDLVLERLPCPARRVAFGVQRPLYFSVHTRAGVVDGPVIAHAMVNGHAPRPDLEALVDLVQPGWRDAVVEARYLSRMVVASDLARAHAAGGRAPGQVAGHVGAPTFLVGDWVDSGALLADGVAASAVRAVDAVCSQAVRSAA